MNNTALALTSAEKKLAPPARTLITDVSDTIAGAVDTFRPATRTAFWNALGSYCTRMATASAIGAPQNGITNGATAKPPTRSNRSNRHEETTRKPEQRAAKTRHAGA